MSIGIDSLNSVYSSGYLDNTTKTKELESALSSDLTAASQDELMDVCKEFEAYFTEQVFKAMKKMVPESEGISSGTTSTLDYFEDMLYQEYAKSSTQNEGLGLAQMLYEQMKRNYNLT